MLLAASFCQQAATMSSYKFTPRAVASPDAPQKPLVRKRARSGGEICSHAQAGRCVPQWSPSPCGRGQQCGRFGFGIISSPLCIAPSRVSSSFQLFAQNYGHLPPPPTPYISEMAFSHRFQKVYVYPPQGNDISAHQTKSSKTPGKRPKPTELAHNEFPREIWRRGYC